MTHSTKSKRFPVLATGAIVLGLSTAAFASPGPKECHGKHMRKGVMEKFDTNKDGTLSDAEKNAMKRARFTKLDANQDGKITLAELKAAKVKALAARATRKGAKAAPEGDRRAKRRGKRRNAQKRFERMDINKDGAISFAEFRDAKHQRNGKRGKRGERSRGGAEKKI